MKFKFVKYFICFLIINICLIEASLVFQGFRNLFSNYKEKDSQNLNKSTKERVVYDSFKKIIDALGELFPLIRDDMMKKHKSESNIIKDEEHFGEKISDETTGGKGLEKHWSLYNIVGGLNTKIIKSFIKLVISSVLGTIVYNFTKLLDYFWIYFELPQFGGDFHFFRLLDMSVPFAEVFL